MMKPELFRMKELTPDPGYFRAQLMVWNSLITTAAVGLVAHYRVLDPGQMDANLMSAPCLQFDIEQRESFKAFPDAED